MQALKIRVLVLTIFIFFLSSFLSCKIDNPSKYELHPLEGKIIFSLTERYENYEVVGNPKIQLSMHTEKIYPCCNYSIATRVSRMDNRFTVVVSGIHIPNICLTALGAASYESFLDLPEGKYSLSFSYWGTIDIYEVKVSDTSIEVVGKDSNFTRLERSLVWRYPPNSFIYRCGTTAETKWICDNFLDSLTSKVHLQEFQFPDSGKIPYPAWDMGRYYDMPAKYFNYEKEEDFDIAIQVLKEYYQKVVVNYPGVAIFILNWRNRWYGNWG